MMIGLRSDPEATLFLRFSVVRCTDMDSCSAAVAPLSIVYRGYGIRHLYRVVTITRRAGALRRPSRVRRPNRNLTPTTGVVCVRPFGTGAA
ncbi:hypothetical protein GCM10009574_035080 [Streptomyces asiaticus]|uniref:Uncharacterized protein n=2 Tax=Streptomyces rhizosphaericus TaxID=114699 RepID=A0ABP4DAT0_9ACTN